MQADSVFDIVTESWQDNRFWSAAEACRVSTWARVSNAPESKKICWTQAVNTVHELDLKDNSYGYCESQV